MASGIGGILTQKLGPIPLWGWLAGAGAAVYLVASGKLGGILGGSGSTTTGTSAQTAAGQATAAEAGAQQAAADASGQSAGAQLSQSLGLLQQLQSFNQQAYENNLQQVQQTQQTTQALSPSPTTQSVVNLVNTHTGRPGEENIPSSSVPIYSLNKNQQGIIGYAPAGSALPMLGQTQGFAGDLGYKVQYGNVQGFVASQDVAGVGSQQVQGGGGVGGPRRIPSPFVGITGKNTVGTVPAMWRGGHALVRAGGAGPLYPHYAVGGPRHVTQIGALTHVHPARVLAANGAIKKGQARPGQIVRVS